MEPGSRTGRPQPSGPGFKSQKERLELASLGQGRRLTVFWFQIPEGTFGTRRQGTATARVRGVSNPRRNVWNSRPSASCLARGLGVSNPRRNVWNSSYSRTGRPSLWNVSNPRRNVWNKIEPDGLARFVSKFQIPEGTFGTLMGMLGVPSTSLVSNPRRNVWNVCLTGPD